MYEQYLADPSSVSESWQEFFADYQSDTPGRLDPGRHGPAGQRAQGRAEAASRPAAPPPPAADEAARPRPRPERRRGPASPSGAPRPASSPTWRPASTVPTATSFREVPAKLLEVNRRVINGYLGRTRGGKVSFTHLIGYAVVRAIADPMPVMNSTFVEGADGKPRRRPPRARRPRPRRRRREGRRQPHPARAGASSDADTLDFRGVLGRLRGPHPQGPQQQAHRPTTSPAPPSPSPTPAPSAPSSRCPGSCPARA